MTQQHDKLTAMTTRAHPMSSHDHAHHHHHHDHDHNHDHDHDHDHNHNHDHDHSHGHETRPGRRSKPAIYLMSPAGAIADPDSIVRARSHLEDLGYRTALDRT